MPLIASQDLVSIDWTLVAQVIAFLILLYFLVRILYTPLSEAMAARTERIRVELSAADEANKHAEEAQKRTQAQLTEARVQAEEILRQAAVSAATMREQLIADARSEAERVIERGKVEIERERQAAFDELRTSVADIAILAATQVVQRSLDTTENRRLVDEAIKGTHVFGRAGRA